MTSEMEAAVLCMTTLREARCGDSGDVKSQSPGLSEVEAAVLSMSTPGWQCVIRDVSTLFATVGQEDEDKQPDTAPENLAEGIANRGIAVKEAAGGMVVRYQAFEDRIVDQSEEDSASEPTEPKDVINHGGNNEEGSGGKEGLVDEALPDVQPSRVHYRKGATMQCIRGPRHLVDYACRYCLRGAAHWTPEVGVPEPDERWTFYSQKAKPKSQPKQSIGVLNLNSTKHSTNRRVTSPRDLAHPNLRMHRKRRPAGIILGLPESTPRQRVARNPEPAECTELYHAKGKLVIKRVVNLPMLVLERQKALQADKESTVKESLSVGGEMDDLSPSTGSGE